MSMPKTEVKYRLIHTIPEAMILLHESKRSEFIRKYIDTGLIGIFEGNKVPRKDIEKVIEDKALYRCHTTPTGLVRGK